MFCDELIMGERMQESGVSKRVTSHAHEDLKREYSFPQEAFARLAEVEAGSFWFRARNELIVWALGNFFPNAGSFLEVGCGTGFVLSGVAKAYPEMLLFGSEVYRTGLSFAASRVPRAQLVQMDAREIPFDEHFDAIGAFDVLEHIEEDKATLCQIRKALSPGGGLLLTVPQHTWLWSTLDELAGHVRRYETDDLHAKLISAGFEILLSTSFVSLLLPAMLLSRFCKRNDESPQAELKLNPSLDKVLETILRFENRLIHRGIEFPLGGSRLIAARRV
ncbi:Generic methyltransferase [Syntrophobacter sp. SbD1]|nr:Generic methyltransferase [Syntrophobacter sp. SbD1]